MRQRGRSVPYSAFLLTARVRETLCKCLWGSGENPSWTNAKYVTHPMSPIKGQDTPTTQSAKIATSSHRSLSRSGEEPTEGHSGYNLDYRQNTSSISRLVEETLNLVKISTMKANSTVISEHRMLAEGSQHVPLHINKPHDIHLLARLHLSER